MNWRISLLRLYIPNFIKKMILAELFKITARAFQAEIIECSGMTYEEGLTDFASYTSKLARRALQDGQDIENIKERLYKGSLKIGQQLRKWFKINTMGEVMEAAVVLYDVIGIDFIGNSDGEITINSCFFSIYYNKEICGIISALDKGIAAGLTGGRELNFTQRLTEGKDCCQALIKIRR